MSSNGGAPKIEITCVCNQRFSAPIPKMAILNALEHSLVVASHEKPIRCPVCRQAFLPVMAGAQVEWGVQPVSDEQLPKSEESRIIKPNLHLT